jgi:LPS sulfotransferase NodH
MYEHLTANPDKVVAAMCSQALIAPPTETLEGDLTILRDATSEHWCERLRRLRRGEAG